MHILRTLFACIIFVVGQVSLAKEATLPARDSLPVIVRQVRPVYPKELAAKNVRGEVILEFIVETDGTVREARVVSQTNEAFGQAALICVKTWIFKPGLKAGVPVRCRINVPIVFSR